MSEIQVGPLRFDTIYMTWDLKNDELKDAAKCYFCTFEPDLPCPELPKKYAPKGGHKLAFAIWLQKFEKKTNDGKEGSMLLIQLDPYNPSRPYLRFTYHPGHLSEEGLLNLKNILSQFFFNINAHGDFEDFESRIKITRMDLFTDVKNVSIEDLLFYRPGIQNWEQYPECYLKGNSFLRGLYLGSKFSSPQFCIYDKAHQLNKKKGEKINHELTRIETRSIKPIPLGKVLQMPNPFTKLNLIDAKLVDGGNRSSQLAILFMDSVRRRGINGALKLIKNKKTREAYKSKLLDESNCSWWNPDQIFSGLPKALELAGLDFWKY